MKGFEARDIGIAEATGGIAGVHVVCRAGEAPPQVTIHDGDLMFMFVLKGEVQLTCEEREHPRLKAEDSFVVPADFNFRPLS